MWNVNDSYADNELFAQDIWQRTLACVPIVYLAHVLPDGVLPGNFQTSENGSELVNPIAQNLSEIGSHFAPIIHQFCGFRSILNMLIMKP